MKHLAVAATVLSGWLLLPTAVLGDGVFSAQSYRPMPQGASIAVRPLDNSDQNLLLKTDFERELENRGYTVSADADIVLTFETRDTAGAWTGGGENRLVELSNNFDQTGIEAPRVRLNLYNSSRGGLLNPDRKEPTRMVTPSEFRIDVTLETRKDSTRLWHGWSAAEIGPGDSQATSRYMIPVLVEGLGKTVSHKAYPTQ